MKRYFQGVVTMEMSWSRRPPARAFAVGLAMLAAASLSVWGGAGCGRGERNAAAQRSAAEEPAAGGGDGDGSAPAADQVAAASHIIIAWAGCEDAPPHITRTRDEAEDLIHRIAGMVHRPGADFEQLARTYTDDARGRANGGYLGIFRRGDLVLAFEQAVFELEVGGVSGVIETEYGFHLIRRMPVLRARAHHIMIAWAGAARATPAVTRSKEQARVLAAEVRARALASGADLCKLARQYSDDLDNSATCGYLGVLQPGWVSPEIDEVLFRLRPKQVSEVVETEYGFHIVWREP